MNDFKNKNVLLTSTNSRTGGGVSEVVRQLSSALNRNRMYKIPVISYDDKYSKEDKALFDNTPIINYHISSLPILRSIGYTRDLMTILENIEPDVIDMQGIWLYFSKVALDYKKKHGNTKTIITPHGMLDEWAVKRSRWKKRVVGFLYEYENLRTADCIKALCESEAKSIRALGLKNPIAIIPNGINLPVKQCDFKKHSERTLLYIGRIHPKKGLSELIDGFRIVKSQNEGNFNKWRLRIAGWDQQGHLEYLKEKCHKLGLDDIVSFIGPVYGNDKERELRKCHAFVLTSFSEGLPMSLLEAWSYKLPVIMTKYCNIPEGFVKQAAIEVNPNGKSIAGGLEKLFEMTPKKLEEMGQNGYNLVKEKFTWDKIAQQTYQLYNWLCSNKNSLKPDFLYE